SPTGEFIAYSDSDAPGRTDNLYLLTVATQQARQLTSPPEHWAGDTQPIFSPDGQMLAFVRVSSDAGIGELYVMPVGGGEPTRLTFDNDSMWGLAWTPDGRSIVFSSDRGGTYGLWRIAITGGEPERVGVGSDYAVAPTISRQGYRLAYANRFTTTSTW